MENTTLPEGNPRPVEALPSPSVLALSIVWSRDEPEHVGALLVPTPGRPGPWCVFGRGLERPDDPHPRLQPTRHRPGQLGPSSPIASPHISRVQLRLRVDPERGIEVERVGALTLRHNGADVTGACVQQDDLLQLGQSMLLVVVRRPAWLPARRGRPLDFPFGDADADGIVGESATAWALRDRVSFVAQRDEHVLITGATGAGKELIARAVHARSSRAGRPLVARNAATLPETLLDAELFGNARNYPNVGMPERPGLIGEANGSTLFLDEIGELPEPLQAHLLRVLDAGEYHRLGESQSRRSSLRLMAATNRPLASLKSDLAARLLLRIEVPDLNARREDIVLLARHLLRRQATRYPAVAARFFSDGTPAGEPRLSPTLISVLVRRRYTTNVRELESALIEAVAGSPADVLDVPAGCEEPAGAFRPEQPPGGGGAESLQACLDRHRGNLERAWRELGLSSRHALVRLVAKHGLRAGRTWRPR